MVQRKKIKVDLKVAEPIVNKQFKIIGWDMTMKDLPTGYIEKKKMWWDIYQFESKEQYERWRIWAVEELTKLGEEESFDIIDMTWGLNWKIEKVPVGQLELF